MFSTLNDDLFLINYGKKSNGWQGRSGSSGLVNYQLIPLLVLLLNARMLTVHTVITVHGFCFIDVVTCMTALKKCGIHFSNVVRKDLNRVIK